MGKPVHRQPVIRCAIYTRKSSEEGLEQEFNSLDAQREACEAYVLSQKHALKPLIQKDFTILRGVEIAGSFPRLTRRSNRAAVT